MRHIFSIILLVQFLCVSMASDLLNLYWNLGRTFDFFRPWLVPRNQKDTVYQGNALTRFFGRRRREVRNDEIDAIVKGMKNKS